MDRSCQPLSVLTYLCCLSTQCILTVFLDALRQCNLPNWSMHSWYTKRHHRRKNISTPIKMYSIIFGVLCQISCLDPRVGPQLVGVTIKGLLKCPLLLRAETHKPVLISVNCKRIVFALNIIYWLLKKIRNNFNNLQVLLPKYYNNCHAYKFRKKENIILLYTKTSAWESLSPLGWDTSPYAYNVNPFRLGGLR